MISVEQENLRRKRQIAKAAGYTVQNLPTRPAGWYALLPGETEFKDNSDAVDAGQSMAHEQNYLGFFSSEADLLNEVVPLADEQLSRHVHLYAVVRVKVCGVDGNDREAIASAMKSADVYRLFRQNMLSDEAQREARVEVAHVEFADEFTRVLVDLVDRNGDRIESTEAYFEGDAESPEIMPGGLSTEERSAYVLRKIVEGHAAGEDVTPLIREAAELLKARLPQGTVQALATPAPAPAARPRG